MATPKYSITTRFGDAGHTRLFSGETVLKCDPRPEAYGDLDELVSVLGVARCQCRHERNIALVLWLQRQLFVIGSELATVGEAVARLPRRCDAALLAELDQHRDQLEASITMPSGFIIPGGRPGSAHLDHARTIARRLERKVVALAQTGELNNPHLLAWLNRLSDTLWLLARAEEDQALLVRQVGPVTASPQPQSPPLTPPAPPTASWLTPKLARDLAAGGLLAESPAWLRRYTTFRLGGPCPLLLHCPQPAQVRHAWHCLREHGAPLLLIGGGSNLLVSDAGLELALIRCADTPASTITRQGAQLRVPAGVSLDELARYACEAGLDGLVNCSGIPGTVGGAVVGNAGAWGWQVGDALVSAELLRPDGSVAELPARELGFAYRDSRLKRSGELVLAVTFELPAGDPATLLAERQRILALRAEKHPHLDQFPCAGSFFRNLEPTSKAERRQAAGAFLEQAGAKAMRVGEAQVFSKHANIIVNGGPACQAQEVYELSCQMADAVRRQFQLSLVREVRLLGPFRDATGQVFDATGHDT